MATMSANKQKGAALVIAMILLLVLTLLAISGMNTTTTELTMAGNEQFREDAFQAAETGIEQALRIGTFNPGTATERIPGSGTTPTGGNSTDSYSVEITARPAVNTPMPAMWGSRWNAFSTFHFEARSQGFSARNAMTTNVQGLFVVAPYDAGTPPPLAGVPTTLTAP